MERDVIGKPYSGDQGQTAIDSIRLITKFFGPEFARQQAKDYCLSAKAVEEAIAAGVREAEGLVDRTLALIENEELQDP